jgi:hypothetical protein
VIEHAATKKAAASAAATAVKKGLRATTKRDGCSTRYEVIVAAKTHARATKMLR